MYEYPTKIIRYLSAAIINVVNITNLDAKLTITQEEGSVHYSTTHVEEALS